MDKFINYYQHIPERLDPVAFSFGNFSVSWYALMYLVGFIIVYVILGWRIKKGELNFDEIPNSKFQIPNKSQILNIKYQKDILLSFLIYVFLGLLIGARLGYVLFYDLKYYLADSLTIISPFSATGEFVGIYGMSYHGGLVGAVLMSWLFCRKNDLDLMEMANFVVPAIPAGYFFGRIGNFLNGELYGRITQKPWGMYFPGDSLGLLRHPSQLYEAGLEGVALFFILWTIRNHEKYGKKTLSLYIIGYAAARIIIEFFREPDSQIGYIINCFTMGQILSLVMLFAGFSLFWKMPKNWYNKKK
jgi:phosphatidylglycerol---prolipoprotein diacylglyceryl transferase